jgi:hypothetical protein
VIELTTLVRYFIVFLKRKEKRIKHKNKRLVLEVIYHKVKNMLGN